MCFFCITIFHILNFLLTELKTISNIARVGIMFICDNFVMHYENIVLRVGGETIKQRLHVVFHWINQHQTLFQFQKAHCKYT